MTMAAEPNIFENEKYRKYKFVEFFYADMRPEVLAHVRKELPADEQEMLSHIEHCRDLQKKAAAKRNAEMWKNFWGR